MVAKQLASHLARSPMRGIKPTVQRLLRRDASQRSESSTFDAAPISPRKARPAARRQVRFKVNARGDIQTHVREYQEHSETDDVPVGSSNVYNNKADILTMKRTAFVAASDMADDHPEISSSLENLLDSPLKFRGSRGETASAEESVQVLRSYGDEIRGLETKICRLLGRHQKWATTAVLRCQTQLQSEGIEGKTRPERVIRKRCEFVNKGPRELALLFAKLDEEEARRIYAETSEC
jgi:hypothetical protein